MIQRSTPILIKPVSLVNIYVQRDPAVVPGPNCPNPASIFTANCALYSEPVAESACTNFGQHIGPVDANGEAFKIAIRGSNGMFPSPQHIYATTH